MKWQGKKNTNIHLEFCLDVYKFGKVVGGLLVLNQIAEMKQVELRNDSLGHKIACLKTIFFLTFDFCFISLKRKIMLKSTYTPSSCHVSLNTH